MIDSLDRMRQELIKAMAGRSVVIRRQCDMTDMAEAVPEKPLPEQNALLIRPGDGRDVLHAGWHGGAPLCYADIRDKSENFSAPYLPCECGAFLMARSLMHDLCERLLVIGRQLDQYPRQSGQFVIVRLGAKRRSVRRSVARIAAGRGCAPAP
jgi:hypothetical protein